MGWSGDNRMMWGDDPQDRVDDALKKRYGIKDPDYGDTAPRSERQSLKARMLADRQLRKEVDATYIAEWERKAKDTEYANLLNVALNLGGRTILWDLPKPKLRKASTKKTKHTTKTSSTLSSVRKPAKKRRSNVPWWER